MTQSNETPYKWKLYGNQANYQDLRRSEDIITKYNKNSLYYSLHTHEQIANDSENLKILIDLLAKKIIKPSILKYSSLSVFTPAYTLITHFNYFSKYLYFAKDGLINNIQKELNMFNIIGGVFDHQINTHLKNQNTVRIIKLAPNKYRISQKQDSYFFSKSTNLFINAAVLIAEVQGQSKPVFIRLRDDSFNLLPNIKSKYFGEVLSPEYRLLGFNLNDVIFSSQQILDKNYKPINSLKITSEKEFYELELSLLDLYKATDIVIKYTSMRKQFQTLPQSKNERRIIQYQAVASRIADAVCLCYSIGSLYSRLVSTEELRIGFLGYFQYIHHIILEAIIKLRECCGGFGYIKYSGLPQLIQRVGYRASLNERKSEVPENKKLLQYLLYFSNNQQLKKQYQSQHKSGIWFFDFNLIALNMRLNVNKKNDKEVQTYLYEFIKHSALNLLYISVSNNYHSKDLEEDDLVNYLSINYIIDNYKYIKEQKTEQASQQYLKKLLDDKTKYLRKISNKFSFYSQIFGLNNLPDVVYGEQNQANFYNRLLNITKSNRRNQPDFLNNAKKPIAEFLQQNNSSKL